MLGATPYLSVKHVTCLFADGAGLEDAMIALNVEFSLRRSVRRVAQMLSEFEIISPQAVAHGRSLFESDALLEVANAGTSPGEALSLMVPQKMPRSATR